MHRAEMRAAISALLYTAGFVSATGLLHAVGVSLGLLFTLETRKLGYRAVQAGGSVMALFGGAILIARALGDLWQARPRGWSELEERRAADAIHSRTSYSNATASVSPP
jgi:hypothetical protein